MKYYSEHHRKRKKESQLKYSTNSEHAVHKHLTTAGSLLGKDMGKVGRNST